MQNRNPIRRCRFCCPWIHRFPNFPCSNQQPCRNCSHRRILRHHRNSRAHPRRHVFPNRSCRRKDCKKNDVTKNLLASVINMGHGWQAITSIFFQVQSYSGAVVSFPDLQSLWCIAFCPIQNRILVNVRRAESRAYLEDSSFLCQVQSLKMSSQQESMMQRMRESKILHNIELSSCYLGVSFRK